MKKINRRQFAKLAGRAALAVPLAPGLAWPQQAPKKPEKPEQASASAQQAEPPKLEPKLKLTPEQEEAVQKAVERRERQLTAIRSRTLPYGAEPAFVFSVRQRPRRPKV